VYFLQQWRDIGPNWLYFACTRDSIVSDEHYTAIGAGYRGRQYTPHLLPSSVSRPATRLLLLLLCRVAVETAA